MDSIDPTGNNFLAKVQLYYEQYNAEELLELLASEWGKAEKSGMPVRAEDNTGVRIAKRLKEYISNEPEVASATVATIGTQVLEHFQHAGYDFSTYEIPISIIIAYLVKAILEDWKENSSKTNKKK